VSKQIYRLKHIILCDIMIESSEEINAILWLVVAVVSLVPISMFFISYIRVKSGKLLITVVAFSLFFIKAIALSMKLFIQNYADEFWWSIAAILDIIIISLILISLSKKT